MARRTQGKRTVVVALVAVASATAVTLGSAERLDRLETTQVGATQLDAAAAVAPEAALQRSLPGAAATSPTAPVGPHARLRAAAAPAMLHIEALGVQAPVDRVGVLADGGMEIPDDIRVVGWYATDHRRVSPGDPGTAVIAGHRDSRRQGRGALHDLEDLTPGARIDVVHADGLVSTWEVAETLSTPRDALPADVLFAREGTPRLALVTCGGAFDLRSRSYSHNTIVLATLVADLAALR